MRLNDYTRFPHPVLSEYTGDYLKGEFGVDLSPRPAADGKLLLDYEVQLTEPHLQGLVDEGKAVASLLVISRRTYYIELHRLESDAGTIEFGSGELFERVSFRPLLCSVEEIDGYIAENLHEEFGDDAWVLNQADILAVGEEGVVYIGQDKLSAVGAIFSLAKEDDVPEGEIRVDLDGERVRIQVHSATYDRVQALRHSRVGQVALLTGVYTPAVMELLALLKEDVGAYEGYRWFRVLAAKAEQLDVDLENCDVLEAAQKILQAPVGTLTESKEIASL